ncbi:MAG: DUF2298 domain-containing protein [Candidatus Shapirobacteria bacterium]|nr:DUF2298 domain-containing protein [Candidatus Shapirobacteria bacterium]
MFADLKFIIFWWLNIFFLSTLSWPFVFTFFNKLWDKGYVFSKIISISILTYVLFVFGILKVLPFTTSSICLLIFAFIIFDFWLLKKQGFEKFLSILKQKYPVFIFEEILFLLILVAWSFVRGFAPDIEGLEKFMDWGFVNSILRSTYMPPIDIWFAGQPINYYYFGQLIFAFITKMSGISSAITYNLSIATVCALTFVSSFSISSNLVYLTLKKINWRFVLTAGLVSSLLLTFGGNLHPLYKISKINYQQNNNHFDLNYSAINKAIESYWYPDATRFIGFDPDIKDKTIHEFPVYSFVVADLHGHMNDIPIVLLFIAFIFTWGLGLKNKNNKNFYWDLIIPSAFIFSLNFMTNAWDFAVYGILFAVFLFLSLLKENNLTVAFSKTVFNGALTIILWYLFTLPFSLNFVPMAQGIRLSDSHSPFYQLFILYGGFWLICLPFVLYIIYTVFQKNKSKKTAITGSDILVISLVITATLLVIFPELFYIKDIYIYEHRRANTMFKLVYEAFIMYSLVSGYILIRLAKSSFYKLIFVVVLAIHLSYPYFAIKSYYGLKDYKGLWGLNFLKTTYPDNLKAIEWINENIKGQPVILEAAGDSYTTFNQVSSATGLPTVQGWIVHEWLWRGSYDLPAARQTDVQKVYNLLSQKNPKKPEIDEAISILQKYNVKYIFVGDKEYEKFPDIQQNNFFLINSKLVVAFGKTKIYSF